MSREGSSLPGLVNEGQLKQLALCGMTPEGLLELSDGLGGLIKAFKGTAGRVSGEVFAGDLDLAGLEKGARALKAMAGALSDVARLSSFAQGGPDSVVASVEYKVSVEMPSNLCSRCAGQLEGEVVTLEASDGH